VKVWLVPPRSYERGSGGGVACMWQSTHVSSVSEWKLRWPTSTKYRFWPMITSAWAPRCGARSGSVVADHVSSFRSPRRVLWQVMQTAPRPTSSATKPASSIGVSPMIRTVASVWVTLSEAVPT